MRSAFVVLVVIILLAIFGPQTLYTVDETQLVVITRFGDVRDVHTSSGLKVKAPFIDSVNKFNRRLLRVDVPPSTLPDREKEFLVIDAYARYRIIDVRKFFEKLETP
ncbi:MAG: protease modulator HflC, partial [Dehalococcoidia bacterium]|nr:protease modulator HflC [Dehalococcoidia bacterium]